MDADGNHDGCWGGSLVCQPSAPFGGSETFTATQAMCPGDPGQPARQGTGAAVLGLAGAAGRADTGRRRSRDTDEFVPGATIRVYINNVIAGVGGAPVFCSNRRVKRGDTVHVVQDLAGCKGQLALRSRSAASTRPFAADPSALDLFPSAGSSTARAAIKGSVYYPAEDDGESQPFNKRLAKLGRVPIVFMAHGNHNPADPSYLGYDYFQRDLAKMGIIAVSIDCNALNGVAGGVQNIEDRADLIIDKIAHFQGAGRRRLARSSTSASTSPASGLWAIRAAAMPSVMVPSVIALPGVTIRAVLALAPTNFRFWNGLATIAPNGYAFMTILPAGDGDVRRQQRCAILRPGEPGPVQVPALRALSPTTTSSIGSWLEDDSLWTPPQPAVIVTRRARADPDRLRVRLLSRERCSATPPRPISRAICARPGP